MVLDEMRVANPRRAELCFTWSPLCGLDIKGRSKEGRCGEFEAWVYLPQVLLQEESHAPPQVGRQVPFFLLLAHVTDAKVLARERRL